MDYKDKERQDIRRKYAQEIEKENPPQDVSHALYVLAELSQNNQQYRLLGGDDMESISQELFPVAAFFTEQLNKIGRDGVIKSENFDLAIYCMRVTADITKDIERGDKYEKIYEIYLTALSALFRLWYEDISTADVVQYYRGESEKEFPSLENRVVNYHWALEKGIYCNDMTSLFDTTRNINMTADDEIEGLKGMADLCKLFDSLRPEVVKITELEDSFIEENLKTCRNVFMITFMLYAAIPAIVNTKDLANDPEKLKSLYEHLLLSTVGEEIKKELLVEEKRYGYEKIFTFTIQVSAMMEEQGMDFFQHSRNDLYKDMAARDLGKK